jgi:hypothetical protein
MVGPGLCPLYPHKWALKPGAISRTTGSATKWNSLTPWFIRHGKVQPLSVTTGLYGRPELGTSGALVSADVCITGSGNAAMATLLTEAAATAPPAMPANLKKSLLDVT